MVCRALLGMGESFNWPCALRVTSGVLPPADRSLGNGIFNSGAAIGAVLTPLIWYRPWQFELGWQYPFVILGLGGLIWVAAWLMLTASSALANATPARDQSHEAGLSSQATAGIHRGRGPCDRHGALAAGFFCPRLAGRRRLVGRGRAHDRPAGRGPDDAAGHGSPGPTGPGAWARSSACVGSGWPRRSGSRST